MANAQRHPRVAAGGALGVVLASLLCGWVVCRAGPRDSSPTVATFSRGRITLQDVERELRSMPPGVKLGLPDFPREVAQMLAARRALAQEARAAGAWTISTGPLGERKLVRALLEKQGLSTPRNHEEAKAHIERFNQLLQRALGGPVVVDAAALTHVVFDAGAPVEPVEHRLGAPPESFFLETPEKIPLQCEGSIHPAGGWYMGFCNDGNDMLEALLLEHVFYLESTYGPIEGFMHRFAFNGLGSPTVYVSAGTARTHEAMPDAMPDDFLDRYRLKLESVEVSGDVSARAARAWYGRIAGALSSCLAGNHWNVGYPERQGRLVIPLKVIAGRMRDGWIKLAGFTRPDEVRGTLHGPAGFNQNECLNSLLVYPLAGTGEVKYTFRVEVK